MHILTIDEAVEALKKDGLLLYPTETYFGIGCRVGSEEAVSRIFKVKKRLYAMPLPIIVANPEQMETVTILPGSLREDVRRLRDAFWPGPLSLIVPARTHLSPLLTGGTGKVALRVSPHPVPSTLAERVGEPIVASSANISGQPPVISASELSPGLLKGVDGVLNVRPEPAGGAPSTLVEPLGGNKLVIHRPGAVDASRLRSLGFVLEEK